MLTKIAWTRFVGDAAAWDAALEALGGSFYQCHAWGEYRAAAGWSPMRLIGRDGEHLVAVAQLLVRRRMGVAIAWVPGGPAGQLAHWAPGLSGMLRRELGCLVYVRMNLLCESVAAEIDVLAQSDWTQPRVRLGSGLSMEVDLLPETDARLGNVSSNWRHNLKRSSRHDLRIERWTAGSVAERAAQMSAIYREMEDYKGLPEQHSQRALEQMQVCLGERLILLRCINERGELLAFRAGGVFAGRGWDLLACASAAARKVYASHALLWALLEACRAQGATAFDMGGVDPVGNKGVYDFKQGTGARLVEYLGEWEWGGVPGLTFLAGAMIKGNAGA